MTSVLKENGVRLELLTDIDMLLTVVMQHIGMQKQIRSIQRIIIKMKKNHFYNTKMLITFMDSQ